MSGDSTVPLSTYTRAVGGTDPHPVSIDALVGHIDTQVDTVWRAAEVRGSLEGAEAFAAAVRELVTLAQSLEGRAAERVAMLRSTTEAVLDAEAGADTLDDLYAGLSDREYGINAGGRS